MSAPHVMPTRHAERHLQRLDLARACAQWGARLRTIEWLTGLNARQIASLLHADPCAQTRGRPPNTPEWYHGGTLLDRTEASVFASIYQRLRKLDFAPAPALLGAYRQYDSVCRHAAPRLNFDRAFDLARRMEGIWGATEASFALASCPRCGSESLCDVGLHPHTHHECPFCKLTERFTRDPRVQMSFPTPPLPDPSGLAWSLALKAQPQEARR